PAPLRLPAWKPSTPTESATTASRTRADRRAEKKKTGTPRRTYRFFHPKPLISGTVFGVDPYVLVGQVSGPDGLADLAPTQLDTNGDLGLGHDSRTLLLGVLGRTPAVASDAHLIEVDIDPPHIQLRHPGVADRCQNPAPDRK